MGFIGGMYKYHRDFETINYILIINRNHRLYSKGYEYPDWRKCLYITPTSMNFADCCRSCSVSLVEFPVATAFLLGRSAPIDTSLWESPFVLFLPSSQQDLVHI